MTHAVRDCLRDQLRHHYEVVSQFTGELTWEQARFRTGAGRPSIAWLLGHLSHCARTVPASVCGAPSPADPDGHGQEHFGLEDEGGWDDLRAEWGQATAAALAALEGLGDADLQEPPTIEVHESFRAWLTTRQKFLTGHVFHVGYHAGQIGALRAAQGLGW